MNRLEVNATINLLRSRGLLPADYAAPVPVDDLIAHARAKRLPKHLWPEVLRIVDAMPMTPAGKIRKADLRAIVIGDDPGSGDGA